MTDRSRSIIRRAAVTVLLFLLAASLLFYLLLPVFERKKAQEIFGRDDVIVGDSFHQPWFYVTEDGTLHLTDWLMGRKKLVFPEYFNGVTVRRFPYDSTRLATAVEEIFFPAGVTLGEFGLEGFSSLRRLVIAEGLEEINMLRPQECPMIKEVYFPKTLRLLGDRLLWGAAGLPDLTLYYAGTEEEWLALGSVAKRAAEAYHMVYDTPVPER